MATGSGARQRFKRLHQCLLNAKQRRKLQPSGSLDGVGVLLKSENDTVAGLAARAIGIWHVDSQWVALKERLIKGGPRPMLASPVQPDLAAMMHCIF